tara:strand:- start:841 stop:1068 length:228 start_codon:yes stop_codon:yes gene_type:complete
MRNILLVSLLLLLSNCSLDKNSTYWSEDAIVNKENQKRLSKILLKSKDITKMTLEEYEIFIDDNTKKSKYPDISK